VETYDQGLRSFPRSLDLAYNKARVQLEVTTHPLLIPHLQVSYLDALSETLTAHRYALNIDGDDPNTLFNTAQVLTTIAEELSKQATEAPSNILRLLEEALELQSKCLSNQELKYEESERQQAAPEVLDSAEESPLQQSEETEDAVEAAEAQWFSVQEPTTLETLIDTALAQLATLTTLCSVLSSAAIAPQSPSLPWIEKFSTSILNEKLTVYARGSDPSRLQEIALAKATFISAFLEASFHQRAIEAKTYKAQRDVAFQDAELQLSTYPDGLIRNAESLMTYASALAEDSDQQQGQHGKERWDVLNTAVTNLATASKKKNIDSEAVCKTHVFRGECSLLLWRLSHPPARLSSAIQNAPQLLKNAEVFYRNASRLLQEDEDRAQASFRSAIASLLLTLSPSQSTLIVGAHEKGVGWVKTQLAEMIEEDLIPQDLTFEYQA
jgi:hypothetical protein